MATSQSAERVLRMIEFLAETGRAGLGTIAEGLGLNKSTAHRFVSALVRTGYARQDPADRTYSLTPRVVEIASHVVQRLQIHRVARPVLEELAAAVAETVHLGILDGYDLVYIDKVEGNSTVRMASRIGARATCHSTALGKVLLAALSEEEWEGYVRQRGLERRTPRTITSREGLFDELRRVREQGWAADDVENEEGIRCVGAPVRDHRGEVVAAISISGWTVSMTERRIPGLVPLLLDHARRASETLGHHAAG